MSKTRVAAIAKRASANGSLAFVPAKRKPRSLAISTKGVETSREFASLMSALMSDVLDGSVTPNVANAAVNAGGKLLKVVELQLKYGVQSGTDDNGKVLRLTGK